MRSEHGSEAKFESGGTGQDTRFLPLTICDLGQLLHASLRESLLPRRCLESCHRQQRRFRAASCVVHLSHHIPDRILFCLHQTGLPVAASQALQAHLFPYLKHQRLLECPSAPKFHEYFRCSNQISKTFFSHPICGVGASGAPSARHAGARSYQFRRVLSLASN